MTRLEGRGPVDGKAVLTITVPQAGAMVGLSRNASYASVQRGEIPVLRFGAQLRVPLAPWLRKIENPEAVAAAAAPAVAPLKQRKRT